jgi:hypothetical protein
MAHGTINIDKSKVGTVLDTNGSITEFYITGSPTAFETPVFDPGTGLPTQAYFCLVDAGAPGLPVRLISFDGHLNGHSPHATNKQFAGIGIHFASLVLQSCPTGATYQIKTA